MALKDSAHKAIEQKEVTINFTLWLPEFKTMEWSRRLSEDRKI